MIINTLPKVPCIYCITNLINNKVYVGSTIDLRVRWREHINTLKRNEHSNKRLQNDFNIYGLEAFAFDVLEVVEKKKEILIGREQWYLDFFDPWYNILKKADSRMGVPQSEETKARLREIAAARTYSPRYGKGYVKKQRNKMPIDPITGKLVNPFLGKKHKEASIIKMKEYKKTEKSINDLKKVHLQLKESGIFKGEGNPFYGKKHKEESLEKMRTASKGNKSSVGRVLSDETKRKIGDGNKGRIKTPEEKAKWRASFFAKMELRKQLKNNN